MSEFKTVLVLGPTRPYPVELGWPDTEIQAEKQKVAIDRLRGIDKDMFLSKVAKAYMAILGDGRGGVHCETLAVPVVTESTE